MGIQGGHGEQIISVAAGMSIDQAMRGRIFYVHANKRAGKRENGDGGTGGGERNSGSEAEGPTVQSTPPTPRRRRRRRSS